MSLRASLYTLLAPAAAPTKNNTMNIHEVPNLPSNHLPSMEHRKMGTIISIPNWVIVISAFITTITLYLFIHIMSTLDLNPA